MSWTIPSDVTNAWIGDGAPTDDGLIQVWIDKAERTIRSQVKDLQARIDAEAESTPAKHDLLDNAVDVAVAMVIRVFRNPTGVRQVNDTTGPFTSSITYGGEMPGVLTLTDDEVAKLKGAGARGAFTVSTIPTTSPFYSEGS
jgi:hypothetical protein